MRLEVGHPDTAVVRTRTQTVGPPPTFRALDIHEAYSFGDEKHALNPLVRRETDTIIYHMRFGRSKASGPKEPAHCVIIAA